MGDFLRDIVARNRSGEPTAAVCVCSAHPDVLRAALNWAERGNRPIVIEATSNQVNQDGGYTGKTPAGFAADLYGLADRLGVDRGRIVLGGDHLGPQAWSGKAADAAMAKARELVGAYARAGFSKIHLDCSMGCAGEASHAGDTLAALRTADLARECEAEMGDGRALYVIGTEVPPPGGALADDRGDIPATTPEAAQATLDAHGAAFDEAGLGGLRDRVAGLVVQPGVEFSPTRVHHLPPGRDPGLREVMMGWPDLCLEAHSTDYQRPGAFSRLAELGFAFQKVGPALTFAYRQAVYSLDGALRLDGRGTGLADAMEGLMLDEPAHWKGHYPAGDINALHQGLSDRIRYYWPHPRAKGAVSALLEVCNEAPPTAEALARSFPAEHLDRADGLAGSVAQRLIDSAIELALDPYDLAGIRHPG